MIEIKKLKDCTISEAVEAWNAGFEGYYFDATITPENFIKRMVNEDLSPTLSLVAFRDKRPIGIVKNGVREANGHKVAWNGGTGVAMEFRSKGIGKLLMESTLSILQEEGVNIATLEAIRDNGKAISLYKTMGYSVIDDLEYLSLKGSLPENPINDPQGNYTIDRIVPQQAGQLTFYKALNPWQTQWQSAKDGEGIVVKDTYGDVLGYAYYRRQFSAQGSHIGTTLFQCEAQPDRPDAEEIICFMLAQVFGDFKDDIHRTIPNLPVNKSELSCSILKKIGFQTKAHQVYMTKTLKSS